MVMVDSRVETFANDCYFVWSDHFWTCHHVCFVAEGDKCGGLNASSLDEIWCLKRHTDRSPNSLRSDSWASTPNCVCFTVRRRRVQSLADTEQKVKENKTEERDCMKLC